MEREKECAGDEEKIECEELQLPGRPVADATDTIGSHALQPGPYHIHECRRKGYLLRCIMARSPGTTPEQCPGFMLLGPGEDPQAPARRALFHTDDRLPCPVTQAFQ
ncbi:unnamed protein product [Gadus morhua 'NCC']